MPVPTICVGKLGIFLCLFYWPVLRPVLLTSPFPPPSRYRMGHKRAILETIMKKTLLVFLFLFIARPAFAQTAPEGIWQGYDGEWRHVSSQLLALAEATPEEKFSWRPAPGVRSTSEVFMHIALANFYLLSVTGPKMPADAKEGMEKSVT